MQKLAQGMMTSSGLAEWLSYLEQLHPKAIDLGLERIAKVADRLGLRSDPPTTLTIAGTNGKGSCAAVIDAALRACGKRVGVYTSPHLIHFNERIVIDGQPASDEAICDAFAAIDNARGDITLSYFEFATLAALLLFADAGVAYQVLEVGLGGRLDGVNIIDANVAVVTSIGLDHTDWLGDTREVIAIEKAGIARSGRPVVIADVDLPVTLVPELERIGAQIKRLDHDWIIEGDALQPTSGAAVLLPSPKGLLVRNVAAAFMALDCIGLDISDARIYTAVDQLMVAGRRQHLRVKGIDLVLDVAHNRESVAALLEELTEKPTSGRTLAIFAAMADKPIHDILSVSCDFVDAWFLPDFAGQPRIADSAQFMDALSVNSVRRYTDFDAAWSAAWSVATSGDRVLVFGSFVTVGAAIECIQRADDGALRA